ncbi:MAG: O-antigen ligase family protein [Planctomycetota bacterium]
MTRHLERNLPHILSGLTGGLVIAALVFAPLAFGAVEPWAVSVLAVLAYSALAAAVVHAVMMKTGRRMLNWLLLPAALALVLVVIQFVPWPGGLLAGASPNTANLASTAAPAAESGGWNTPSLYPHATRRALLRLSVYIALFVAVCAYARSSKQVTRIASAIVAVGFGVALFGIIQNLSGTTRLYWWREINRGGLFGPFVSRNQFAAYVSLCLFTGLGLLIARGAKAAGSVRSWWRNVGRETAKRSHQNFLIGFAVSVMGAAVIWSLSRAGIASMLLAFAGVMLALRLGGFVRAKGVYVAVALLVIVGWATYLGWEPVVNRFSKLDRVITTPSDEWRLIMTQDAGRMGAAFPALGTGAGTFLSVYPYFKTLPTYRMATNPHNEYACVFGEAGVPGLLVLALAGVLLYGRVVRGLIVRRHPYVCGLLAGGFGALLALSLHSVVDFPMRSPAIAGTAAVVAALLYRAAGLENNHRKSPANPGSELSRHDERHRTANLSAGLSAAVIVGLLWFPACHLALNPLRGQIESARIERAAAQITPRTDNVLAFVNTAEQGIESHSPRNAGLYAELADLAWAATGWIEDPAEQLALADKSLDLRLTAARLEPVNGAHQFELALGYAGFGRTDLATRHADLACDLRPNDPWTPAYLAEGFLQYGRTDLAARYLDRAEALARERDLDGAKGMIARVRKKMEPPGKT